MVEFVDRLWSQVPRVLHVTTDMPDVTTQYRTWWPSMELAARGYTVDYCTYGDLNLYEAPLRYGRYNTIVTPRMAFYTREEEERWLSFVDELEPIKWWYDSDDDLFTSAFVRRMVTTHTWPDKNDAARDIETQRASRVRLIKQVDGITVANTTLTDILKPLSLAPIAVVPNGINARPYVQAMEHPEPRVIEQLTVGWSGGPRLEADIEPLTEVWTKLAELRPDVHFILQGWLPPKLVASISAERLHCIPGVPNERYPSILQNIDVFCCVAGADDWNLSKTPIKWFEATLAGCACVVSKRLYGPAIDPPYAALVVESADEWLRALLQMVDDPQLRQTVHDAALKTVLSRNTLQHTYSAWLEAWSGTLAST